MAQNQLQTRYTVLLAVLLCYFFPFLGLASFTLWAGELPDGWLLFSLVLLCSAVGSLVLYMLMMRLESSEPQLNDGASENSLDPLVFSVPSVPSLDDEGDSRISKLAPAASSSIENDLHEQSLKESKAAHAKLQADMTALMDELQQMQHEKERLQHHLNQSIHEKEASQAASLQEQEHYKNYVNELQLQIMEQKQILEKKQYQITHLETKVSDLTYEIKTLLQIAERHLDSPSLPFEQEEKVAHAPSLISEEKEGGGQRIHSAQEASIQLKRSLDIAQKMTGSSRFNAQASSFLDSPADSFTPDLRRLCDTLRCENDAAILLYSPKENQPLFVNNHIRELTGWSPEKFVQNFNDILGDSLKEWNQGFATLGLKQETAVQLSLKMRSGPSTLVKAHLGLIPTGIFRHHAIAILY